MEVSVEPANGVAEAVRRGVVSDAEAEGNNVAYRFADGGRILVSRFLAVQIGPGDEIAFPLTIDSVGARTELYIRKSASSRQRRDVYQAPISYAAQPTADKRGQLYVRAEVSSGRLGISTVHLLCDALRDYFYVANRHQHWER